MTRHTKLTLIAIVLLLIVMPFVGVWFALADGPIGGKQGASPDLTVRYAGQTFAEVSGSLTGEDWQHDPSVIYRLSVTPNHPNLVFAAHSDAAGFYLYQLAVGDPVVIEGRIFTVTDTRIVITDYFFASVNWFYKVNRATLFTCFPEGAYYPTGRLIITAEALK